MVNLSGGELGGTVVDGAGWALETERTFDGLIYRRISEDQAVFCGIE
jgi:hypothetical protein